MLRSRLFWEIVGPYFAFCLVAWAGLMWFGLAHRQDMLEQRLAQRLSAVGTTIGMHGDLFRTPAASWQGGLKRLAERQNVRLTVITADGTPLADTETEANLLGNQRDLPPVPEAMRSGIGHEWQRAADRLVVVVAAHEPAGESSPALRKEFAPGAGVPVGFIRVESSTLGIDRDVRHWLTRAMGVAAVLALLGLIWIGLVARGLARGIGLLTEGIRGAVENGTLPPRHMLGRSLAQLSGASSDLTTQLSHRIANLRGEKSQLAREKERLANVLAGMGEGVLAIDQNETVLFANNAAGRLLDVPAQKLVGRPLWEVVRIAAIQESTRAAFAGHPREESHVELPRSQVIVALRAHRLPTDDPPGVVLVLHDITELRRLENLRKEFVSNVSHELKTPLASIQAYTETLLDGAIDDPAFSMQFLRRISEQADRLHDLILDLLRLARIEAGTDVFEIQKLSATKMIETAVDEHAAVARSRGVMLSFDPPSEFIRLQADFDGMRSILDNLLDNALYYTPEGGRVTVRAFRRDGMAIIEVDDTGIGIPAEHLQRIFERFHRVDKARNRERGGTGLGLAIVKHLLQVFGGRIEVESQVGKGSLFRVFLPSE